MATIERMFFRFLETLMVFLLASMAVMVFVNVVLRYFFNSGLDTSDELSRFMFMWLTFVGAVVAVREGGHLGVDMVLQRVSPKWQAVFVTASHLLMIACCFIFFWGLWMQHDINMANTALITEVPLGVVYGIAYFSCGFMALILAFRLYQFFSGKMPIEKLMTMGSGE